MKTINLTQGYKCQVSDEDFLWLNQFKWCAQINHREDGSIKNVYARRTDCTGGVRRRFMMHRVIMNIYDVTTKVDHKDHSGLNNQRSNLRVSTEQQNQGNRKLNKDNASGFKGVTWLKRNKKWGATVSGVFLGLFLDAREAAHAYDREAEKTFGEFALTNKSLG